MKLTLILVFAFFAFGFLWIGNDPGESIILPNTTVADQGKDQKGQKQSPQKGGDKGQQGQKQQPSKSPQGQKQSPQKGGDKGQQGQKQQPSKSPQQQKQQPSKSPQGQKQSPQKGGDKGQQGQKQPSKGQKQSPQKGGDKGQQGKKQPNQKSPAKGIKQDRAQGGKNAPFKTKGGKGPAGGRGTKLDFKHPYHYSPSGKWIASGNNKGFYVGSNYGQYRSAIARNKHLNFHPIYQYQAIGVFNVIVDRNVYLVTHTDYKIVYLQTRLIERRRAGLIPVVVYDDYWNRILVLERRREAARISLNFYV